MNSDSEALQQTRANQPGGLAPATLCLVVCFLAFTAGLLLASTLPPVVAWASLTLAAIGLAAGLLRRAPGWLWPGVLALALFGAAHQVERARQAANYQISERIFHAARPPFDTIGSVARPEDAWLTERDEPRVRIARIEALVLEAPPPPEPRHRLQNRPRVYIVQTETIASTGGPAEPIRAQLRLAVRDDARLPAAIATPAGLLPAADPRLYPLPGQRIEAIVALQEIQPGQVAPGQFDAHLNWLLAGHHAHATLDPRQWRRLPDDGGFAPLLAAHRAQLFFSGGINRHTQGREADTLRALCWGDTSDLTWEDRLSFQQTGTVHLLAVSGLHIYVVLYLLMALTRPLIGRRHWRYGLLAVLLWAYAAMTGFQEPVLRAVLMFSLWIGARCFTRRFDALNAWAVSGLAMLCCSPASAHTVGFQLSYLTVGMLIWWAPALSQWLHARVLRRLERWLLPSVVHNLAQSLAAGSVALVATLPVVVYYFGVAPAWAVLANLVLIPLFELLLLAGLPLSIWFAFSDPGLPASALQSATGYGLNAADGLAALCGSPGDTPPPAVWALVAALGLLILSGAYFRRATAPPPATGAAAIRWRFSYPSFSLTIGAAAVLLLALTGATPKTASPELLLLGRTRPCIVALPDAAGGWQAFALAPPDSPGSIETLLRRPIASWHFLQSPAIRAQPRWLTPGVLLACDSPTARQNLATLLAARSAGDPPAILLLYPTSESAREPALPKQLAVLPAHRLRAVILLASPWRLLEADAQAWLDWSHSTGCPVVGADAAPLWHIAANGATLQLERTGESRPWTFEFP